MSRDQRAYLNDILQRIALIESYSAVGREAFLASQLHQDGVVRSFEIIGEIVKRLDNPLKDMQPTIKWSEFAGLRDLLAHQYEKVLPQLLWDYVHEDIPPLKFAVQSMIASTDEPPLDAPDTPPES